MYQASKKTDFTVDLIWWGLLRLAPINFAQTHKPTKSISAIILVSLTDISGCLKHKLGELLVIICVSCV